MEILDKYKFLKNLLILFPLWGLGGFSYAQVATKLTLQEVVEMAKSNSISARQSLAAKETKFWEFRSFQSNYKPQLLLSGNLPAFNRSYTQVVQPDGTIQFLPIQYNNSSLNLSLNQTISQTGGTIYATTVLQRFDDFARKNILYNSTPFAIGYQQPIFRFNPMKWDKIIEPLKFDESRQVFLESREQIAYKASQYFFSLLLAQVNHQIAETNLSNTQVILKIANEKYDIGIITRNEILQLKLESLKAQKAIGTAKQDLESSMLNLKAFIGLQNENKIELIVPSIIPNISISAQKALAEALENRSDAIYFRRQILEADRTVAKAIGDNGLNATLTASLGFSSSSKNIPDLYNQPKSQQNVALTFDIPILDWGRSKSRTKTAEVQKELTTYTVEQSKQNFKQQIYTQVTLFEMLRNQLSLNAEADSIASEKYQIAKERYMIGNLSITDLSIAFQEKDQAKRDNINALQDFWQTYFNLRALTLYDFENEEKIRN